MAEKLYFVDGYHGGIEGHMPDGSWEDILDALERRPEWKISLEVEPESWDCLKRQDYPVYRRLQDFVSEEGTAGRIEFISGAYGQPFCWAINGESNVRQLLRGREVIGKHFPAVVVDTYAVQEPCFTSALPQICKKLGYKRISLKNPTSWGGYMDKMKGGMIRLSSADGSSLPAVPRYDCEELVGCSATEAAGYDFPAIRDFAEKCVKQGIRHPVGMCLQDLGWSSHPLVNGIPVEYVTWREYFDRFGGDLEGEMKFSQDAVLCALPWGNIILQQMCRKVRSLENHVLQTEKLLAFAQARKGELTAAAEQLKEAWDMLLLVQHHDGYICATTKGSPYKGWAVRADYLTLRGEKLLEQVENTVWDVLQVYAGGDNAERYVRVYNTLGAAGKDLASVDITLPKCYYDIEVYDSEGKPCPSQWQWKRRYQDDSIDAAKLYFEAAVEGLGYQTYCIRPLRHKRTKGRELARATVQDTVEIETALLHIVFDRKRGGTIVKLYDKQLQKEFAVPGEGIGALKGYLVDEKAFVTNGDSMADVEILENGSVFAKIRFFGEFHGIGYETIVSVREGDRKIDIISTASFAQETNIGYPYKPDKEEEFHGRKRSGYREDYKLGIQIPLPMTEFTVTKHAPYENYESNVRDSRYLGWDEIRNNVVNQFIDFYDAQAGCGMAVLCDHINGYSLVDHHFSLTQAFGYYGGFWWGYQPIKGESQIAYSLIPHSGDYEGGLVPYHNARKNEPLRTQLLAGQPEQLQDSLICVDDTSIELVTVFQEKDHTAVRLFNHGRDSKKLIYRHNLMNFSGTKVDLCGNEQEGDGKAAAPSEIVTLI